jgi:hypothetical protein
MAPQLTRRRFTVGQRSRMGQAGMLGEDDREEILGEVAPSGD